MPPKATTFLAHKYMCMCISLSLSLSWFFSFFLSCFCVCLCSSATREEMCFFCELCVCVYLEELEFGLHAWETVRDAQCKRRKPQQQQQQSKAGERRTRQNTPTLPNTLAFDSVEGRGPGYGASFFWPFLPFLAFGQYCGVIQAQPQS